MGQHDVLLVWKPVNLHLATWKWLGLNRSLEISKRQPRHLWSGVKQISHSQNYPEYWRLSMGKPTGL
jgi:hypothetical protein